MPRHNLWKVSHPWTTSYNTKLSRKDLGAWNAPRILFWTLGMEGRLLQTGGWSNPLGRPFRPVVPTPCALNQYKMFPVKSTIRKQHLMFRGLLVGNRHEPMSTLILGCSLDCNVMVRPKSGSVSSVALDRDDSGSDPLSGGASDLQMH